MAPARVGAPPPLTVIACAFTAVALVFGGGGSSAPLSELVVELAAAAFGTAWIVIARRSPHRPPWVALALAAVIVLLPAIQLVPLPPALWHHLPGHALERGSLALVGDDASWRAWSVAPARTLASLLALGPPALALCLASCLDRRGRDAVLITIAAIGLLSVLLGALQLADGAGRTWRFYVDNPGFLNGFQANRNAEADVLLIATGAVVAAVAALRPALGRGAAPAAAAALAGLLLLGCALTGSRGGILLIPPVVLLAILAWQPRDWRGRGLLTAGAAAAVALALAALLAGDVAALRLVAARFTWDRDFRLELWRDSWTALRAYWPFGSGVGTFKPVFIADERLEVVDPSWPVRAHDDYLEFAIEGGVFALLVLGSAVGLMITPMRRALRRADARDWPQAVSCIGCLLVVALHAVVDYPLRSMALAHLEAVAAGMLIALGNRAHARDGAEADAG